MPRLPDYTALGERPTPSPARGVVSYTPSDPTTLSRGVTAVGKELEQAANLVAATNQRQDEMVAEAALNRLQAQRLELEMGEGGFQSVKGGGAVGQRFVETYGQKYTDAETGISQSLENDNQRRMFQQRAPMAQMQFRAALLKHQAQETDRFNTKTEEDTIDLARRQIFTTGNDPMALDAGLTQINWAIEQRGKRLGWGPEVVAATKAKFTEAVMEDVASMMVERDPVGSLAALNKRLGVGSEQGASGVTAIDAIDPQKLVTLRHRAASYVAQADNKMKAEAEKRLKEAENATKELQTFALSGVMVSPAYEREVLAKVSGTPYEAGARQLISASYTGATHGSLPLPAQEDRLRRLDGLMAATGSSPDDSKLAQTARQITETQRAAYKDNPWAAATRFGRQPEVPPAQIQAPEDVPKLIAQRLPLMIGVETFAGQPVSPLQPMEAKAFTESLKKLPPESKAEILGQTGAMLSAPRAAALVDQLDKHDKPLALSLAMGMDRTTAGRAASTYVLRGAQAIADKTVKKDDSALAGWRAEISGLVRGALGDDQAESQVIDAAYFVRAALEQEGMAPSGFKPMSASAENAIAMVIGRPMERAGFKTFLPRGMNERDFDEKLKSIAPTLQGLVRIEGTDVQRTPSSVLFVRGTPVPVDQIASRLTEYGLKRDGSGRYIPIVRNAPVTLDPQGRQLLRLEVR